MHEGVAYQRHGDQDIGAQQQQQGQGSASENTARQGTLHRGLELARIEHAGEGRIVIHVRIGSYLPSRFGNTVMTP